MDNRIIQIMAAPKDLVIIFNGEDIDKNGEGQGYLVTCIQDVLAYGLYSDGDILPLVEGERGNLESVGKNMFIRTYFKDEEKLRIEQLRMAQKGKRI